MKILFVVNPDPEHLGGYFTDAARSLGHEVLTADLRAAAAVPTLAERIRYRIFDKRPRALAAFSAEVVRLCREQKPDLLLTTGCAPVRAADLKQIRSQGIKTANFSTDDPWSKSHRSHWFLRALPQYDLVCTPRRDTIGEFAALGVTDTRWLPFAYHPPVHHKAVAAADSQYSCDVLFYGGADDDRVRLFSAFKNSGLMMQLYGSYWDRLPEFRPFYRGKLAPAEIPAALAAARVTVCIARRSNRDSHAMRSYEAAAMAACMIVEDSADHLQLFGPDGKAVCYFRTPEEAVARAKMLLNHNEQRAAMRVAVAQMIGRTGNTYADRLNSIIEWVRP